MFQHKDSRGLRDAVLFGRVLSVGLVVAGYAFLGVWLSGWLSANGYPAWAVVAVLPGAALFGLWQGWLFLTRQTGVSSSSSNSPRRQDAHQQDKGAGS